jgi:diketogulonate reductase-like aldo/keto reductase
MKGRKLNRGVGQQRVVITTKIVGGRNITQRNIVRDCNGSLKRLGVDYVNVYQLRWPAGYSPQSNWGQSLAYSVEVEESPYLRGWVGRHPLRSCAWPCRANRQ